MEGQPREEDGEGEAQEAADEHIFGDGLLFGFLKSETRLGDQEDQEDIFEYSKLSVLQPWQGKDATPVQRNFGF